MQQPSNISVLVNSFGHNLPLGCTLSELLAHLGTQQKRLAIAVNRQVIPRSQFDAHQLQDGDRIEILEAVGGG